VIRGFQSNRANSTGPRNLRDEVGVGPSPRRSGANDPKQNDVQAETTSRFEAFTSSQPWRDLPLKIKLMVLHIWRRETDTPNTED
jgi:hypothetical protein